MLTCARTPNTELPPPNLILNENIYRFAVSPLFLFRGTPWQDILPHDSNSIYCPFCFSSVVLLGRMFLHMSTVMLPCLMMSLTRRGNCSPVETPPRLAAPYTRLSTTGRVAPLISVNNVKNLQNLCNQQCVNCQYIRFTSSSNIFSDLHQCYTELKMGARLNF